MKVKKVGTSSGGILNLDANTIVSLSVKKARLVAFRSSMHLSQLMGTSSLAVSDVMAWQRKGEKERREVYIVAKEDEV